MSKYRINKVGKKYFQVQKRNFLGFYFTLGTEELFLAGNQSTMDWSPITFTTRKKAKKYIKRLG